MRKTAITSGVVGLILLVAAGLMAWWITPSYIARLPSGYNKTRTYDGTIGTLVNPAALSSGNLSAAIKTGLPGTFTNQVKVLQTSGNSALIENTRTASTSGTPIAKIVPRYAVNRQTLEATTSHPSSWSVTPAKGLTVNWPLGAKKQNYTGWVPLTQTTVPLKYVKQAQVSGMTTQEYQSTVPPTPIKNAQVLASLPKTLPVALLPRISAAGLIPPSDLASLARAFPHAKAIPLGYTYQATNTYWVAPPTGIVVNLKTSEVEKGGIALPTGKIIPLIPVLADSYHQSPSSVTAAVNDANNGSSTISTWGTVVPIVAAIVGFLLLVLAVLLWIFGRSRGRPVDVRHDQRHPSPAGVR